MGGRGSYGGSKNTSGEVFVKMPPTATYKDGKPLVIKTADGQYIYQGGFDKSAVKVDTSSAEYRQALRDNNVKFSVNSDGSVKATRGGLYTRAKTFKTVEAFIAETNTRFDQSIAYNQHLAQSLRSGVVSPIHAENMRSTVRSSGPNAMSQIGKEMRSDLTHAETRVAAAQDMKSRFNTAIDEAIKRKRR